MPGGGIAHTLSALVCLPSCNITRLAGKRDSFSSSTSVKTKLRQAFSTFLAFDDLVQCSKSLLFMCIPCL